MIPKHKGQGVCKNNVFIQESYMFFSCINICRYKESCLNTRPLTRVCRNCLSCSTSVNATNQILLHSV